MAPERVLVFILRLIGTSSLFALPFVVLPSSWLAAIHADLGLGEMPDTPVVWYLARSLSAFYALLGGLFWTLSFDLVRYRAPLVYLSWALTGFGVCLSFIDWIEGLPFFWRIWEGPFITTVGVTMIWASRRLPRARR